MRPYWTRVLSPLRLSRCGEKLEPRNRVEHPVVRRERQPKSDCDSGDPPVAVVDLATQRMTDSSARLAQLSADADHLVVGLDDNQLSDASFQSAATQLAPSSAQCAVAQFHDRL